MSYLKLSQDALAETLAQLQADFESLRAQNLNLDLTRGKPSSEQLDLSKELDGILDGFYLLQDGTDVRNYGGLLGIPEARKLGGELLGVPAANVLAGGNSSLTLMYQFINHMIVSAWSAEATIRFLCPVPGYDRHFAICEHFGIEMLSVPMTADGPDMDMIENLVSEDASIKGIWCVPKYSNPTGHTYSAETVQRLAKLPGIAGKDFRIMWDNAYAVHHLTDNPDTLLDLMGEAEQVGHADAIAMFGSTSKITFAGAGVAFMALSTSNLSSFERYLGIQTIGADKVNQLRHVHFLKDKAGISDHMEKHQKLLEPRFEAVQQTLEAHLGKTGVATWTRPNGGYFVSLDTLPGLAKKVVQLAGEVGVKLTPAGATFPYGQDPEDRNIRIAPTFPKQEELTRALNVLAVCIQLASVEALMNNETE